MGGDSTPNPGGAGGAKSSSTRDDNEKGFRSLENGSARRDHLGTLVASKSVSCDLIKSMLSDDPGDVENSCVPLKPALQTKEQKEAFAEQNKFIKDAVKHTKAMSKLFQNDMHPKVQVRVKDFTYKVKYMDGDNSIQTVYNQSCIYDLSQLWKRLFHGVKKAGPTERVLLDSINLVFKPGQMYLILGNPGTGGKEALLKAVAGRLRETSKSTTEGTIQFNSLSMRSTSTKERSGTSIENCVTFIDKIDFHEPRLSVKETLTFAFDCKAGGTHAPPGVKPTGDAIEAVRKADIEKSRVLLTLQGLSLEHVGDTFVGNADVRGVSGGQRRRVSVGEMTQSFSSVLCGDEVSTGLDAAATFDICNSFMFFSRVQGITPILSLLQPSPETVSLFDEIILMADGKVLYAGPISDVEPYFRSLGYEPPDQMSVADFLQEVSTPGGMSLYNAKQDRNSRGAPYSIAELADEFRASEAFHRIMDDMAQPWPLSWADSKAPLPGSVTKRFRNSLPRAVLLNLSRELLIWIRDQRFLIANAIKNVIMGISVGGVFFQAVSNVSIFGVCFQINLFIMLGAMTSAPAQVDARVIYFKHSDANFFGALPFVIGKAVGLMPQAFVDVMIFGSIIYWMVGFTATVSNYFIFIAVLFVFSIVMNQMLSIFAALLKTKAAVQGASACILLFLVLFSGFIVNPDVIPSYYVWIYWWNPLAWTYRALLVNEFQGPDYDQIMEGSTLTEGELALLSQGFGDSSGIAFGREWIAYNFAYNLSYFGFCVIANMIALMNVRVDQDETGGGVRVTSEGALDDISDDEISIEVKPVTMTFQGICYDVQASKGSETIRLLNDVNGVFASKRMVALMGSSGAGKTTLMDVIAMRKTSGTISGQILINGFPQERTSFRRVSGYVEQFDVQSPELTVKETVLYSARLRLNFKDQSGESEKSVVRYVDSILRMFELTELANCLVGSDNEGGLSFEQRKRLSIAVELAAGPSVIFLDEPTSGLDARAAAIVVRILRRIADSGRTVIATIHQPSLVVFRMFDELLLLQKGGKVVFFGELGPQCKQLTDYFEGLGADPIEIGENPADWMLKVTTSDAARCDFSDKFVKSTMYSEINERIRLATEDVKAEDKIVFESEYATTWRQRQRLTEERFRTIYFRSPAYNLGRIVISMSLAFILGSVFLPIRRPSTFTETEIGSVFSTIFISFIIIGVLAIVSVLPVMLKLRDIFYKHRSAGMIGPNSVALALGVAEKWFIVLSSALFCLIFLLTAHVYTTKVGRLISFWGFFTFNAAIYSYFGQAFMCLVRGMGTAQILASVFIGLNNFFSGLIVRPQYLYGLFEFTYWITPGHYVYEGLILSLFDEDYRLVYANDNSQFFLDQGCAVNQGFSCNGTVAEYVDSYFGGKFVESNRARNIGILAAYLIVARFTTFLALKYFNYTST